MPIPIPIPSLIGGVSRLAQSQRLPTEVEVADNVTIDFPDGTSKRAATLLVKTSAALTADTPTQDKHIGWINRDENEQFFFMIDPVGSITTIVCSTDITTAPRPGDRVRQATTLAEGIVVHTDLTTDTLYVIHVGSTAAFNNSDTISDIGSSLMVPDPVTPTTVTAGTKDIDEMIEVFAISDGSEKTVVQPPDEVLAYLAFNAWVVGYDPRRRLRSLTIADTTLLVARNVLTALRGADITYQDGSASDVRRGSNSHNVANWSALNQPPASGESDPVIPDLSGEFGASATLDFNEIWFTNDDDIGNARGWWWAVSETFPPWYQRIRTEGSGSMVNERTYPMRMDFDGTQFSLKTVTWPDRFSGDSATNPGPSFVGSGISDLAFFQNRLWLASGEILASSQTDDLFNFWKESEVLNIDSDPIDVPTSSNRVANIDFLVPFGEALLLTTNGAKQYELRADGPMSPSSAFLAESTRVDSVNYVEPGTLADQLYFASEADFANVIYEYLFDPQRLSNKANNISRNVRGYIPAQLSQIESATAHDTVFFLTDAEKNNIYCYKTIFDDQNQKVMGSWYRWTFPSTDEILSIQVFDENLYMVIRRNSLIWLEKVAVGQPEQDTIGTSPNLETMTYQVRLDSRLSLQGSYSSALNQTTWTIPFVDDAYTEVVLGPGWDVDVGAAKQRLAGTLLKPTVSNDGSNTKLVITGQFEDNLNGDPEIAYVGKPYVMTAELSEQFARSEQGVPVQGRVSLLSCIIRHKDTGFYAVRITAENRTAVTKEFIFPRTGSTFLDGVFVQADGQFESPTVGKADSTKIEIINDSPLPCTIVNLEFKVNFRPSKKDPTR